ncbi:probable peroxisomal acyl-coenzyme A oxidase 1 [Tigriopus californicus]|uniref:probable peroxisomal acyl-coenzyme A oxidase 1 n=1 Tax=Tigriopus californicus TaxID=6832 RepID=UPI0027DA4451|nr:probable peroxisomal acyl-coenzyme A oxidase 1 [Tigriopus californicus]|eukprot:TCALIF_02920-PA protein Name:"Similar to CG5009 Probable peroxisomal acyl-coenzyme A oxidase 1 (Drosophila melanogaster)" AED:0.07 eAED:0.07 QI:44/1/1/1/0.5/0.71/7/49/659
MKDFQVNPDLLEERMLCPFDQEELTNLLDGGKQSTEERRRLEKYFLQSGAGKPDVDIDALGAVERYEYDIKKSTELFKIAQDNNDGAMANIKAMVGGGTGAALMPDGTPLGLHFIMFIPTLMGQGTLDQQAEWLGRAWNMEIIGTYAQTELGHGTFIRGLETTATYDERTQEFILHSPTITAYKWWPGGLGKTANHAVVMAQLITKGQKRGPHPFFVQLRDEDTHVPLKGIKIGEIGPKLGMNSNDNGYLGFESHRIPRKHLLMKNAQVLPDGTYVKPAQDKLSYGTMIFVRVCIVEDACLNLKKSVTIAARYSCVRHQSELLPGAAEPKIMEYQTQQFKILVPLSMCVGFVFVGQNLWQAYSHIQQDIEEGNFDKLPELHALSSGLKALVTQECADAMDSLRRACGGHGFMCNSNLPRLWGLVTASCTYEGENTVLQLQVARFVMKCLDQDQSKPLPESMKYLRARDSSSTCTTIRGLVLLFQTTARNMALKAQLALKANEKTASHKAYAWNQTTVQLSLAALATVRAHVVSEFATAVENPSISEPLRNILRDLFELLALAWIQRFSGDFLQYGGAQAVQISWVQERILVLLAQIRPIAVSVVDAFDIPDEALKSTLGSYDGRVYERMLEAAMRGPLNEKDVPDAFHKYLKPMMQSNL